jgi:copper chaperone CopZ
MAKTISLHVEGMTCQGCAHSLTAYLKRERGVLDVQVDWRAGRAVVTYDPALTGPKRILASQAFQGPFRARRE